MVSRLVNSCMACVRLLGLVAHLFLGLGIVLVLFPWFSLPRQQKTIRWWSRWVLRWCGMRLQVLGTPPHPLQPAVLVSNHISWIDIFVINAINPIEFVAKAEIRGWPLVGLLCARTRTIFIERGRRHAIRQVLHTVQMRLQQGAHIGIFPEGTTSDGTQLLPFHANLFSAVSGEQRISSLPLVPLALRYVTAAGVRSTIPAFIDEMSLLQSMWQIACHPNLVAQVNFCESLTVQTTTTRHQIAEQAYAAIAAALDISPTAQ